MIEYQLANTEIQRTHDGEFETRATLSGQLTAANIKAAKQEIITLIENQPDRLILDISRLTQLDASGLSLLTELNRKATSRQVELVLLRPTKAIIALLEMTRLRSIFTIENQS